MEKFRDFRFFDADTGISDCYFGIVFQGKSSMEICPFIRVFTEIFSQALELTYIIFQYIGFENAIKAEMLTLTAFLKSP